MAGAMRSTQAFRLATLWLHAVAASQQLSVSVINHLPEAVDVWWVNPSGDNVLQGALEHGEQLGRNTFVGHRFAVHAKDTKRVLKRFTVTDQLHTIRLIDDGTQQCDAASHGGCQDDPRARCPSRAGPDGNGCHSSPGWMIHFCPKSCDKALDGCRLHDPAVRCNRSALFSKHNVSQAPAFVPGSGGMADLFRNLEEKWGESLGAHLVHTDPPIAVFDSFMTTEEALAMRDAVGQPNFKRSTASGSTDASGYTNQIASKTRTSTNAWCMHGCESNPTVKAIIQRISSVVNISSGHFEALQLLRYETGQYYRRHHDFSDSNAHNPAGPRILTFFMYLSDVSSQGETEFTDLDPPLKVTPRIGRAVLWPSVLDDMRTMDARTFHTANPVGGGLLKFAANAWIHQHNVQLPSLWGCTGSFTDP